MIDCYFYINSLNNTSKLKQIYILFIFLIFSACGQAQVGINTPSPDPNSILDLRSTNKGLLIPRLTTVQREAMSSGTFAQGMTVYDTDLDVMFVGYGAGSASTKWFALNAWETEYRTNNNSSAADMTTMTAAGITHGNVGIGVSVPNQKLDVNGKVKATEFIGNGAVPLGGIILWSGTVAPTGWTLCDGDTENGYKTPNLRNRFVVGYNPYDARYNDPGDLSQKGTTVAADIGGLPNVTLDLSEMPRHNHGVNDPGHTHGYWRADFSTGGGYEQDGGSDQYNMVYNGSRHWVSTQSMPTNISIQYGGGVGTAQSGSNGAAHENRPPYYTLAYIMRVY